MHNVGSVFFRPIEFREADRWGFGFEYGIEGVGAETGITPAVIVFKLGQLLGAQGVIPRFE